MLHLKGYTAMYVCVCNAVTERHIEAAVSQGATRLRDLRDSLGVATECGRCAGCAHKCLKAALKTRSDEDDWVAGAVQAITGALTLEMEAS